MALKWQGKEVALMTQRERMDGAVLWGLRGQIQWAVRHSGESAARILAELEVSAVRPGRGARPV
jgi:hypothetical protein